MAKWNHHELNKYNAPSMAEMGTDKFSCWKMLLDKFSDYNKVAWLMFLLILIFNSCGENANCDETIFDIVDVLAQTIPIV